MDDATRSKGQIFASKEGKEKVALIGNWGSIFTDRLQNVKFSSKFIFGNIAVQQQ